MRVSSRSSVGQPIKPPFGATLIRGHALAPDVGCWLFNENGIGGNRVYNLVNGVVGTVSSAYTWGVGGNGVCAVSENANNTTARINTNDLSSFSNTSGTIAWAMTPGFSPTNGLVDYFWGEDSNSGANPATPEISCQKFSTNAWFVGWNNASGDRRLTFSASSANLTQGLLQHYVFTWGTAGSYLYRNGVLLSSSATVPTCTGTAQTWCWGHTSSNVTASTGAGNQTKFHYGYIYKRQMTQTDVQRLYLDPFAGIQWRRRQTVMVSFSATVGVFSTSGSGTAAFTGKSTAAAALTTSGSATATFTGAATAASTLAASGSATATFTGGSTAAAALTTSGSATATFTGLSTAAAALAASGSATVAFTALGTFIAAFSISGSGTATFTGASTASAVLAATGSATVTFTGVALFIATLSVAGVSTVGFTGAATASAVLAASGVPTVSMVGASTAVSTATLSGAATVSFTGLSIFIAALSAVGTAAWSATGKSTYTAVLSASGFGLMPMTGKAVFVGTALFSGLGSMDYRQVNTHFPFGMIIASQTVTQVSRTTFTSQSARRQTFEE